mgnify:CR=1 FL=1
MLKKVVIIVSLALGFSSLFWWSWAFSHMTAGNKVCFDEPITSIAFIEMALSILGSIGIAWIIIRVINVGK